MFLNLLTPSLESLLVGDGLGKRRAATAGILPHKIRVLQVKVEGGAGDEEGDGGGGGEVALTARHFFSS